MKLFSKSKPKIKIQETKRESFDGWLKCSHCKELIHLNELEQNTNCCPKCDYHYRLSIQERVKLLTDENTFTEMYEDIMPTDPLNFVDTESYKERLASAQKKTARNEGIIVGVGKMNAQSVAIAILDFAFMGGSMGSVVGEKLTLIIEHALEEQLPLVIVSASGGARMQESSLSLMQMAKTSAALARFGKHSLPYISVLTNPTTGGVTASFASLGDIIIADPKALICFAGPRVIEQTIGEKLPPEAQKSEFLLAHGMLDCVVRRKELKSKISTFIQYLMPEKLLKKNQKLSLENLKEDKLVNLERELKKNKKNL